MTHPQACQNRRKGGTHNDAINLAVEVAREREGVGLNTEADEFQESVTGEGC